MKISCLILTKNEEENISDCIRSVMFCDEIIIIDDNSTDNTVKIAKKLGVKVYRRNMNKDYASQSNFALAKANNEWTLMIDADERVTKKLKREIQLTVMPDIDPASQTDKIPHQVRDDNIAAYRIPRQDFFLGKKLNYGETGGAYVTRLVNKNKAKWERRVHPKLKVNGQIGILKNPILHYPHNSVSEFVESVNRWSSWHALSLSEERKSSYFLKIIFWPFGKFLKNYLLKKGYLDGTYGFVHAILMSFHSFLAWSELWLKEKE